MIKINYYGVLDEVVQEHGLKRTEIEQNNPEIIDAIMNRTSSNMLGFLDLPYVEEAQLDDIISAADEVKRKFDNFMVFGMGGSALGTKTLFKAFERKTNLRCLVFDNVGPFLFVNTIKKFDITKTAFNIVSKSGTTTETMVQFMVLLNMFEEIGFKEYHNNIFITTEDDSELAAFARAHNIKVFNVPKNMCSRFGTLSSMTLFPAAVYGIDIKKLLQGAKNGIEQAKEKDALKNPALLFAKIATSLYDKGKSQIVLAGYGNVLSGTLDFMIQLWAESLGKACDRDGKPLNWGQTPIKAIGATYQHSQLQLFCEGPNNKLISFVRIKEASSDLVIRNGETACRINKTLVGLTLKEIMDAEREATAYSLVKHKRPNLTITIDKLDEVSIGEFIMFCQLATVFAGEMLNVNAFNQPSVEAGKIFIKALLNKKPDDKYYEEISEYIKNSKNFEV